MKKQLSILMLLIMAFFMIGCKSDKSDETFLEELSDAKSYKVEGILETFFENGRRQSNFTVYYKAPDFIKVVLQSVENEDQQIILKNTEGVFVLIPSVNKNFKIQSSWPTNASYPYLLQSLAKDIANDEDAIITETESTYTVETDVKMHKDAQAVKQKIIFDVKTNLPSEVLVMDSQGDLFIRCVFTSIDLNYDIKEEEFNVEKSMTTAYLKYENGLVFADRSFSLPAYCPDGLELKTNVNVKNGDNARAIMQYKGSKNLTIIGEYVNYQEQMASITEIGEVIIVMGNVGIMNDDYIKFVFEGVEYTIASSTLSKDELYKVSSSYMMDEEK